jgi:hypothetical protein
MMVSHDEMPHKVDPAIGIVKFVLTAIWASMASTC